MSCAHKCYIDWILFEWFSLELHRLFIRSNSCARPLKTNLHFWLSLSFAVKWQVEKRKDMRPTNLSILWITLMGLEYYLPFISVFINRLIFLRINKLFAKVESMRNQNRVFRRQNLNKLEGIAGWKIRSMKCTDGPAESLAKVPPQHLMHDLTMVLLFSLYTGSLPFFFCKMLNFRLELLYAYVNCNKSSKLWHHNWFLKLTQYKL